MTNGFALLRNATLYANRNEWLDARRNGIGGSDVPAILGLSPYASALSVWESKVGIDALDEDRDASSYSMRRGAFMEPFIADELRADADGLTLIETFGSDELVIARHPDHPMLAYSPDALFDNDGVTCLGEFKSQLRSAKKWEEDVPEDVKAQAQHGMYVLDLHACYVACDLGHELRWARVDRDPEYAEKVVPLLLAWWDRHVIDLEPPAPSGHAADRGAIDRIYPAEDAEESIGLDVDLIDLSRRDDEIGDEMKALKEEREAIRDRIRMAMGTAAVGVLADGSSWTWKTQQRKAYVVKASSPRVLLRKKAKEE